MDWEGGRKEIHRRQDGGRREAGENPGWSDEICPAFYWIVTCLLIDCVLPFDRLYSAFYWIMFCLLLDYVLPFDRL